MRKFSIIIPYYNRWDLTHQRMAELFKYLPIEHEIVLVNDASTQSDCETGVGFWQKHIKRHIILYTKNEENLGFGRSMNRGALIATGDVLVFLSNDVYVRKPFVDAINSILDQDENVLIGGEVIDFDSGWNGLDGKIVPYCNGWLVACTKDVWYKIGGFDGQYGKFDYEDVDLSCTALSKMIKLKSLPDGLFQHMGSQTINTLNVNRAEQTYKNRDLFVQKWTGKLGFL